MQDFNYHQHTYRCRHADLNMKDDEYIEEYIKNGFKKIAFTDHCPEKNKIDVRPRMRMDYEERIGYLESIKRLKKIYANKIEILSGYEIEYLPDDVDNLMELKRETDILIQGQHFIYDDDKNLKILFNGSQFNDNEILRYANYIKESIELGIPDIIAHPDLFLQGREGFGPIDEKVTRIICDVAEKNNIPIEINLNNIFCRTYFDYPNKKMNPYRLPDEFTDEEISKIRYPSRNFWKIASEYKNLKVLFGIDVHFRGQITLAKESIEIANKIIGDDVISKLNFVK